jgi:hypothetical protein
LNNLEELHLLGTDVTDAGLAHLEKLTDLKSLFLDNTNVTSEGVEKLQRALPNCQINHIHLRLTIMEVSPPHPVSNPDPPVTNSGEPSP